MFSFSAWDLGQNGSPNKVKPGLFCRTFICLPELGFALALFLDR
jgi:hypothetical protein